MTLQDAYNNLPEYLAGGLTPEQRTDIAALLRENEDFMLAMRMEQIIDEEFSSEQWHEPSAGFTWTVLGRAGMVHLKTTPVWVTAWENAKAWISVVSAALILTMLLVLRGSEVKDGLIAVLEAVGSRLDAVTGLTLFSLHPLIVLGMLGPIIGGGLATVVLTTVNRHRT